MRVGVVASSGSRARAETFCPDWSTTARRIARKALRCSGSAISWSRSSVLGAKAAGILLPVAAKTRPRPESTASVSGLNAAAITMPEPGIAVQRNTAEVSLPSPPDETRARAASRSGY